MAIGFLTGGFLNLNGLFMNTNKMVAVVALATLSANNLLKHGEPEPDIHQERELPMQKLARPSNSVYNITMSQFYQEEAFSCFAVLATV